MFVLVDTKSCYTKYRLLESTRKHKRHNGRCHTQLDATRVNTGVAGVAAVKPTQNPPDDPEQQDPSPESRSL